ncbi:hypothetical protein C8F01DRAFT_444721 [Mycena amicta]|nr:hypothetical protein C8F01DRAFT_444721 [Mycena amicta]
MPPKPAPSGGSTSTGRTKALSSGSARPKSAKTPATISSPRVTPPKKLPTVKITTPARPAPLQSPKAPTAPSTNADNDDDADDKEDDEDAESDAISRKEKKYALQYISDHRADLMNEGRGFKGKVFTIVAAELNKQFPKHPQRTGPQWRNCVNYIKGHYNVYKHARAVSVMGWDEQNQHVVTEPERQKLYLKQHGTKKAFVFRTPFHFFAICKQLFGGNKATGQNAYNHNHNPDDDAAPLTKPSRAPLKSVDNQPINVLDSDDDLPSPRKLPVGPKLYQDELLPVVKKDGKGKGKAKAEEKEGKKKKKKDETQPKSRKRKRAESDEEDDENSIPGAKRPAPSSSLDRSTSGGSTVARRNAEGATQMASSLRFIGENMSAPIVTKADTSHVDALNKLFADKPDLLPKNARFFAAAMKHLSQSPAEACALIGASTSEQQRCLLALIFTSARLKVPAGYLPNDDNDDDIFMDN